LRHHLFALLVSEGGLREALTEDAASAVGAPLESEVLGAFKSMNIFGDDPSLLVRDPVRKNVTVRGNAIEYSPAFVQRSEHLCVMETVDFTTRQKKPSQTIQGRVDKDTQRVSMRIGDKENIVVETGLYNLTQNEAPMLVHFGPDKVEDWLLVRLENSETQ
jgi:hypothetical protein